MDDQTIRELTGMEPLKLGKDSTMRECMDSTREIFRHLADLLDPTCTIENATWVDGTYRYGCICSACGAKLEYEYAQDLAYCPKCGARNEGWVDA